MTSIDTYQFSATTLNQLSEEHYGRNWPVVYIIEDGEEAYIGETIHALRRAKQHLEASAKAKLHRIHVIYDSEYNKSATLDTESFLIQRMAADGKYTLLNSNAGLKDHQYYDREYYQSKFPLLWQLLKNYHLVKKDLVQIENSDLFKYSPYKALREDQLLVADKILEVLDERDETTFLVHGKPGTGKTILATYLFKLIHEKHKGQYKMALVVPMTSLRSTLKKVFKSIHGLKASMVLGPSQVAGDSYDLIIVDEAHRLRRRKNLTNLGAHDAKNRELGLDEEGTELDWILQSSKNQILFYDENQSIRPSDVRSSDFKKLHRFELTLEKQIRVNGGEKYIEFISGLFNEEKVQNAHFEDYQFEIIDDISVLWDRIQECEKQVGLSRLVAGYAWPWNTKTPNRSEKNYDIEIDGHHFIWNSTNRDWINSENAINEVGCIHTVQGYDLNYVGVIIGPELTYNTELKRIEVIRENYYDRNGHAGVDDPEELKQYILNIYKTLCTRAIQGTFLYVVDEDLQAYIKGKVNV